MPPSTAVLNGVGFYCGRFGPGFWGEPLNQLANLTFVAGAAFTWFVWRRDASRPKWEALLFLSAAGIGVGSLIFHGEPTPKTLLVDLIPIQVFGLAFGAYVLTRYLGLTVAASVVVLVAFVLLRQAWIATVPQGALGGGATHVPTLLALGALGVLLRTRKNAVGTYIAVASLSYACALLVRSWDLYLCPSFPVGVHWLWHVLTAVTASVLLLGVARVSPYPSIERT